MSGFAWAILGTVVVMGVVAIRWNHYTVRRVVVMAYAVVALITALWIYEGGFRPTALLVEAAGGTWNADAMAGAVAMRKVQLLNELFLLALVFFLMILCLRRPK